MPKFWVFRKRQEGNYQANGQIKPPWGDGMQPDIRRHFEMVDRLEDAPPIWRETIALELIRLAPQTIRGFEADYAYRKQVQQHQRLARLRRTSLVEPFALPSHAGFRELAIGAEKVGDYDYAVQLCMEAKRQGWAGDWDERITRCRRKGAQR